MSPKVNECASYCPLFHETIELIGRRWTGAILRAMPSGETSFGAIRDAIPGISDRLLTERLKELEGEGIIERSACGRATTYQLTDKGRGLQPVFDAIVEYTERWVAPGTSHR